MSTLRQPQSQRASRSSGPTVTPYFNQIDARVPQCIHETPEASIIHCHRVQNRASGFHGVDLMEVLEQIEGHRAGNSDLVRGLCHLRLDLSVTAATLPGNVVQRFTHFG
jgi:hypothetical protein